MMNVKLCSLLLLCFLSAYMLLCDLDAMNWQMTIEAINYNPDPEGMNLSNVFIIGENVNALNGYDPLDIPALQPTFAPFIWPYVLHTTWGAQYNGRYQRDLRHTDVDFKTWNCQVTRNTPYSSNYELFWNIPDNFPPYYNFELTHGQNVVDMREQESYSYISGSSTISFQINTLPVYGIPYIITEIDSQHFSDNLQREINLNSHFGVLDSFLNFEVEQDTLLVQSLTTANDSTIWSFRPINGWEGATEVNINAIGNAGNNSFVVSIVRDDTNSPPYYIHADEIVEILQNQGAQIDLHGTIFDDDLDPVGIEVNSGTFIQASFDPTTKIIDLVPETAFKGSDYVMLVLTDGVNDPNQIQIDINVHPSEPKPVENVQWQMVPAEERSINTNIRYNLRISQVFHVTWDEVSEDTNDMPITGVIYRVLLWQDAYGLFDSTAAEVLESTENELYIETSSNFSFLRIIAVNPDLGD